MTSTDQNTTVPGWWSHEYTKRGMLPCAYETPKDAESDFQRLLRLTEGDIEHAKTRAAGLRSMRDEAEKQITKAEDVMAECRSAHALYQQWRRKKADRPDDMIVRDATQYDTASRDVAKRRKLIEHIDRELARLAPRLAAEVAHVG